MTSVQKRRYMWAAVGLTFPIVFFTLVAICVLANVLSFGVYTPNAMLGLGVIMSATSAAASTLGTFVYLNESHGLFLPF